MRILHVLRAPIGGLMRHVADLCEAQARMGHQVGLVCGPGNEFSERSLKMLERSCPLGIHRLAIHRLPGWSDVNAAIQVKRIFGFVRPEIIHGHGAKGGALARLGWQRARVFYTPHGGTLHFSRGSPAGCFFILLEWFLRRYTTGLLFVCEWERNRYDTLIGIRGTPCRVVRNGVQPVEFQRIEAAPDAADVLFVGELRPLKDVETLLRALARIALSRPVSAAIVGEGPSKRKLERLAGKLGLSAVRFVGAQPFPSARRLGLVLVIPSRHESLPYVVLEAVAGGLPVIATRVGGIPEILPESRLVTPGDVTGLASAIERVLVALVEERAAAGRLADMMRDRMSIASMAGEVTDFYSA